MKRGNLYTVLFTVTLSCCCASALTFANMFWGRRAKANESAARLRAIVTSVGLADVDAPRAEIRELFERHVTVSTDAPNIYDVREGGCISGHAVDFVGYGLHGPIRGVLAIEPDRVHVRALAVYECNETPSMADFIYSREWLNRFRGIQMVTDWIPGIILSPEPMEGNNVVLTVTKASKTRRAVQLAINKCIAEFLSGGQAMAELDLGVVAGASPDPYVDKVDLPPNFITNRVRQVVMVPEDAGNLAEGKPVTSSIGDALPFMGVPELLTDGSRQSGDHDFFAPEFGAQWVQIDLEETHQIYAVAVWHFYKQPRVYTDVVIQVADDPDFSRNVRTLYNSDADNSLGFGTGEDPVFQSSPWPVLADTGKACGGMSTPARYVRAWTGDDCSFDSPRFVEIAVYGVP